MVSDIDLLHSAFVQLRAQSADSSEMQIDNTNFLLNLIDKLAGDDEYIPIRSRSAPIARLGLMEELTETAKTEGDLALREAALNAQAQQEKLEKELQKPLEELNKKINTLNARANQGGEIRPEELREVQALQLELAQRQQDVDNKQRAAVKKIEANLEREQQRITRELNRKVLYYQNQVKTLAVALPPIPPIVIGIIVFVLRRLKEREGGLAYVSRPATATSAPEEEVNQALFPDFTDPLQAESMQITQYDAERGQIRRFEVSNTSDGWQITSKGGYPANATQHMTQAANSLVDLIVLRIVSDLPGQHAEYGVVEPNANAVSSADEGVGQMVTIDDKSDKTLANIIIGAADKE
ncbi:unnamed protein product, partial [Symbiodinium microadriaticum]